MRFDNLQFLVESLDSQSVSDDVITEHPLMSDIDGLFDFNTGNKAKFDDKFRPDGTPRARHMKGMTGIDRSTGQNLIPDVYKVDPTANSKVEQLRKQQTGIIVLNGNDIKHIVSTYNITDLTPVEPKHLGKTGITIFYNPSMQKYCIKK